MGDDMRDTFGKKLIASIRGSSKKGLVVLLGIPDVAKIRKKMMLSQRVFSEMYHINIETLKKWEQNKRIPDSVSRAYLKCIQGNPKLIYELVNK